MAGRFEKNNLEGIGVLLNLVFGVDSHLSGFRFTE